MHLFDDSNRILTLFFQLIFNVWFNVMLGVWMVPNVLLKQPEETEDDHEELFCEM